MFRAKIIPACQYTLTCEKVNLILIPQGIKVRKFYTKRSLPSGYFVLRISYMNVTCFQEPTIAMETLSLLLCGVLLLLGTLFLYSRNSKRAQFIRMMEQIPGPRAYPIIGTVLPFLLKKRSGE